MRNLTGDEWGETAIVILAILAALVVARILALGLRRLMHIVTRATNTRFDDKLVQAIRGPLLLLVAVQAIFIGVSTLSYLDHDEWPRTQIWLVTSILLGALVVQRVLGALLEWYAGEAARRGRRDWSQQSLPLVRRLINVMVFVVAMLVGLDQLGLSISPLLAGLGIGGLAVALALQPLLSNIFAGSYVLSDGSIRVGDFIELDKGPMGWVEDIGWRATRVRNFDSNIVVIPNATLATTIVTNYSAINPASDARVVCGVAYEEDLARVEAIALDVLRGVVTDCDEATDGTDPFFAYTGFGDSNVQILMKVQARSRGDVGALVHEIVARVHARFATEGIAMSYPARRLIVAADDVPGLTARDDRVDGNPTV